MDELFKGTKIDFKVYENRQVILSLQPESKAVDQKKSSEGALISDGQNLIVVSGIVINERGELLAGANIKAKGSSVATQTAANGSFSIKVPDNVTKLVVSYIGMEEQEVAIGKSPLTIVLKEIGQKMDEVVVIGYGTQKKANLTGSVSNVTSEKLNQGVNQSVGHALQGQASGVTVIQNSGEPGSRCAKIFRKIAYTRSLFDQPYQC